MNSNFELFVKPERMLSRFLTALVRRTVFRQIKLIANQNPPIFFEFQTLYRIVRILRNLLAAVSSANPVIGTGVASLKSLSTMDYLQ